MMNKERAIFVKKTNCKIQLIQGMENCTLMIYPLDLLKPNTYIKLNTKTQYIFCCVNENLTTFLYTLTGGTRKQKEKKVFFFKVYTKVECY